MASNPLPKPGTPLSRREHQVVELMVQGLELKQVAHRLSLSTNTICMHVARAKARTCSENLVQLGIWAHKAGYSATSSLTLHSDRCNCRQASCDGISCG